MIDQYGEYETLKSSMLKTQARLRYLYYSLLLSLLVLFTLFSMLLLQAYSRSVELSLIVLLGLVLIALIVVSYLLFKKIVASAPLMVRKTEQA